MKGLNKLSFSVLLFGLRYIAQIVRSSILSPFIEIIRCSLNLELRILIDAFRLTSTYTNIPRDVSSSLVLNNSYPVIVNSLMSAEIRYVQ